MGGPKVRQRFPAARRAETLQGRPLRIPKLLKIQKRGFHVAKESSGQHRIKCWKLFRPDNAPLAVALDAELFADAEFAENRVEDIFGRNFARDQAQ
jgi:hypothetical protein